jgi:RNA polymerase sigma factor (sigma-70 family)
MLHQPLLEQVAAARLGSREAFAALVGHYQGLVSATTLNIVGDFQQSEDIAQEAFLRAWNQLAELSDPAKFPAWLCGIARNCSKNWLRRQERNPLAQSTEFFDIADKPATESKPLSEAEVQMVWRSLADIPETYREPMLMFYRHGAKITEIADALELTEEAVRQRLSRGRKMLKAEVEKQVETVLERSGPNEHFTVVVLAALPILATGEQVLAAGSAGAAAAQSASSGGAGTSFFAGITAFFWTFFVGSVLPAILTGLGVVLGIWSGVRNAPTLRARQMMIKVVLGYVIAGSFFHLLMSLNILGLYLEAYKIIPASWDDYCRGATDYLLASFPVLVVIASVLINRRWRKIVEEDSAKAGMERSAMTGLRSVYIWGGIALFTFLFAMVVSITIMVYAVRIVLLWESVVFFLCFGAVILVIVLPFFYFAVRISKDQECFEKYPPRLPNLLPILTGEEKAPRGFRNRINFWGDLVGIGWAYFVFGILFLSGSWFDKSLGEINLFLSSLLVLAYFLFALFFAGIPRRRYWGMIFLGVSTLLIVTCVHFIHLTFSEASHMLHSRHVDEHWKYFGLSFWYLLCFTLLGVGGLWVFRRKGVRS